MDIGKAWAADRKTRSSASTEKTICTKALSTDNNYSERSRAEDRDVICRNIIKQRFAHSERNGVNITHIWGLSARLEYSSNSRATYCGHRGVSGLLPM